MFGTSTKTDIEPTHQDVDPAELIPVSHLALDLPVPAESWSVYLHGRNIPVVVDDIGRDAISRDAARQLFTEHRENQVRAREVAARQEQQAIEQEQQAIEQDQRFRARLYRGQPWHAFPPGVTAGEAWAQAEKDSRPRRRSVLEDALTNQGTVFHPVRHDADES
jgi:hypothetical protein